MTEQSETTPIPAVEPGGEPVEPKVIDRSGHPISRKSIPESVLKVLYRLHRSGYRAYLCGGSVRDLLMGRKPKDFDIATDAGPGVVRRLFRNSRIIGRRFRLVHVIFQDKVLEVSTFRREPDGRPEEDDLLVRDDNVFGTPAQDARRRDFTVNGLFYNIDDFSVIDFVGGLEDLANKLIRVIGDPDVRFREDPVRMLRAVEFAARLDFEIEADTWDAIVRHRGDILKASPVRVSEEILELLRRGWALEAMHLLVDTQLLEPLIPELFPLVDRPEHRYLWKAVEVLDRTVRSGRQVSDAVLFSVLMLPVVMDEIEAEEQARGERMHVGQVLPFVRETLEPVMARLALPGTMRHQMEQAFETLWRLIEPPGDRRSRWRIVFRERFQDGLALYELYALSSGRHIEAFREWQQLVQRVKKEEGEPPRKRRTRKKKKTT